MRSPIFALLVLGRQLFQGADIADHPLFITRTLQEPLFISAALSPQLGYRLDRAWRLWLDRWLVPANVPYPGRCAMSRDAVPPACIVHESWGMLVGARSRQAWR